MTDQQFSYRQILKATSLFGGVQIFTIVIAIIRSKFIAILLGTTGMGITGLLMTVVNFIGSLTHFGLETSAVKSVANANASGNQKLIALTIIVMRRWVWLTGLLGMIITIITAPWLSRLTFGNSNYTFSFIWISVSLLLVQLSIGQNVLLQGMRKLTYLAKANLTGSILGLLFTVPLYYWLGIKGIVPAIIITSLLTLVSSWYFARKVDVKKIPVTRKQTLTVGKGMLMMGLMISLSSLITNGNSYIVRAFIGQYGSIDQVGLYTAGFAILSSYVGLIFTSMGTDYYPRLSSVAENNTLCRETINQQAEIAILILAPIILIFLVFIRWFIIILYSDKFTAIDSMIHWAVIGIFFKATSWAIAFILLAKGASKLFFWNELVSNVYVLGLNLLGYYLMGLTGLGISFLIGYILYFIQVFVFSKIKYDFYFHFVFVRVFIFQFTLAVICFLIIKLLHTSLTYVIGSLLIIMSCGYSFYELDKRVEITKTIKNHLTTKRNGNDYDANLHS